MSIRAVCVREKGKDRILALRPGNLRRVNEVDSHRGRRALACASA